MGRELTLCLYPFFTRDARKGIYPLSIIIYLSISLSMYEENFVIGGQHNFTGDV